MECEICIATRLNCEMKSFAFGSGAQFNIDLSGLWWVS